MLLTAERALNVFLVKVEVSYLSSGGFKLNQTHVDE